MAGSHAGCPGGLGRGHRRRTQSQLRWRSVIEVLVAPADLIAVTGPGPDGSLWVLAGNKAQKTLSEINVALRARRSSPRRSRRTCRGRHAVGQRKCPGPGGRWRGGFQGCRHHLQRHDGAIPLYCAVTANGGPGGESNATGSTVYELREGAGTISSFLLGTSNGLGFDLPLTGQAVDLVPGPNSSTIVLQPDGTVSTVAFPSLAYTPTVSTGSVGKAMAISPDGSTLFVLHPAAKKGANASVSVINATTHQVEKTISVPPECTDIAISPAGTTLYAGLRGTPFSLVKAITVP